MRGWFHTPVRLDHPLPREWFWQGLAQLAFSLALLVVMLAFLVWVVHRMLRALPAAPTQARAILDERYARGELTREQYLAMRRDLERSD